MATVSGFAKGMNNVAPVTNIPEGYTRDLLNVDALPTGELALRTDAQQVQAIPNIRGGVPTADGMIVVADNLWRFNATAGYATDIGPAPAGDAIAGAELNGVVYLRVGYTMLKVVGHDVMPWASPEPAVTLTPTAGSLRAGRYRVAVTTVDASGAEGGATPYEILVPEDGGLQLAWSGPGRLYVSAADGATLYYQGDFTGGTVLTAVRDDTQRMTTENLTAPPLPDLVATHNGRLLLACNNVLWFTEPFSPHLANYVDGHISYDAPVDVAIGGAAGVFVAAGRATYLVRGLGTEGLQQATLANIGGVHGSQAQLRDGRVVWMTEAGAAFGLPDGTLDLPHLNAYAPALAQQASAGVVTSQGRQMYITNLKGAARPNTLGITDSFDLEIDQ